jgi:hypothetical protein
VQGKSCLDCHQNIYNRPARPAFRPPPSSPEGPMSFAVLGFQAPVAAETLSFSHARHRDLTCTACHSASGPTHGSVTLRSVRDCQQCHHGATVAKLGGGETACLHCHRNASLPAGPRNVEVRTSTSATALTRSLPFAHATHATVTCAECHTTPVTLAAATQCSGCHAPHHTAARNCQTCHNGYDAHRGQQVHLGCAGSGCHSDQAVLALSSTRNVCLSCHTKQVTHKPGRDCGTCHRVQWAAGAARPAGARAPVRHR